MLQVKTILITISRRGRYFAEKAQFCLGHFWGAPGQNFSSMEENQKTL